MTDTRTTPTLTDEQLAEGLDELGRLTTRMAELRAAEEATGAERRHLMLRLNREGGRRATYPVLAEAVQLAPSRVNSEIQRAKAEAGVD